MVIPAGKVRYVLAMRANKASTQVVVAGVVHKDGIVVTASHSRLIDNDLTGSQSDWDPFF